MHPIAILAAELEDRHIEFEMGNCRGYVLYLPSQSNCRYWIRQERPHSEYYRIFNHTGDLPAENGLLDVEEVIQRYWELKEEDREFYKEVY